MRKISSLDSKDVAVEKVLTRSGYQIVAQVAEYLEPIQTLANTLNEGVDTKYVNILLNVSPSKFS